VDEAEVEEDQEDIIELGNARSTIIIVGNYSVSIDIVKHLSARSIDAFWGLGTTWHRFLGIDELAGKTALTAVGQRKRTRQGSLSGLALLPNGDKAGVGNRSSPLPIDRAGAGNACCAGQQDAAGGGAANGRWQESIIYGAGQHRQHRRDGCSSAVPSTN
jgi:hypothetical protein